MRACSHLVPLKHDAPTTRLRSTVNLLEQVFIFTWRQHGYITPGNMEGDLFGRIVEASSREDSTVGRHVFSRRR
jgi:hypothetical protein